MKENRSRFFVVTVMVVLLLIWGGCVVFYGRSTKKTGPIRKMGQKSELPSVTTEISETPIPSAASWSIAKQSGRKEDFEVYFKRDLYVYTKERSAPKGKMKKIQYYSKVIGEKREVYVYTPPRYTKDKKYPVLYLLHGIGCDGSQWISMKADNVLDNMIADGECVPCVAVCPSITPKKNKRTTQAISPENIEAYEKFDRELTEDLMPFINSHYNVSDKRKDTAVAGLSMGGMESLLVGFSHLDRFNYIGSFSAAPSLDTSLLKLKKHSIKPKLIVLCSGTSDSTVGDSPEGYHNILAENRVDHIWYLYPDGGHSYEVWLSGLINFLQRMKVRQNWN